MTVTIVQLYPDELGVAGDRGNVLALVERLRLGGIESDVVEHRRGDTLPDTADCVVIGSGPLSAVRTVLQDARSNAGRLRDWVADGVPVFAFGAGAELLGHRIETTEGEILESVGVLPFSARRTRQRKVGYIVVDTATGPVVGFEDNASLWILDAGATPLGTVSTSTVTTVAGSAGTGAGNGDGREGVVAGASVATQVGGPVLPLNPTLTARLVDAIAARASLLVQPSEETSLDRYAARAREVIVENASHVFSRI